MRYYSKYSHQSQPVTNNCYPTTTTTMVSANTDIRVDDRRCVPLRVIPTEMRRVQSLNSFASYVRRQRIESTMVSSSSSYLQFHRPSSAVVRCQLAVPTHRNRRLKCLQIWIWRQKCFKLWHQIQNNITSCIDSNIAVSAACVRIRLPTSDNCIDRLQNED